MGLRPCEGMLNAALCSSDPLSHRHRQLKCRRMRGYWPHLEEGQHLVLVNRQGSFRPWREKSWRSSTRFSEVRRAYGRRAKQARKCYRGRSPPANGHVRVGEINGPELYCFAVISAFLFAQIRCLPELFTCWHLCSRRPPDAR